MARTIKILILDDCPINAALVERLLKKVVNNNYQTKAFNSAEQALKQVRKGWASICLVDYHLADGTAEDFIEQINHIEQAPPVVVMTSANELEIDHRVMRAGAMDFLSKDELSPSALERSIRYVMHHTEQQSELRLRAERDLLTGLLNRGALKQRLDSYALASQDERQQLSIIFIDLDGFKLLNDSLGHDVGDQLLRGAAERLSDCVDRLGLEGWVARTGGDEFVVALKSDNTEMVSEFADEIFEAYSEPFELYGSSCFLSASIGLTAINEAPLDHEKLLRQADQAMFEAKRAGRNQSRWYASTQDDQLNIATNSLILGFNNKHVPSQLQLWGQPQFDTRSESTSSLELLARYHLNGVDDKKQVIAAGRFIETVERGGHAYAFGIWALEKTVEFYQQYHSQLGARMPRLGINIGATQYLNPRFVDDVDALLAAGNMPGSALEIEITESCLLNDLEQAIKVSQALRERDVGIAMDDFGTGYSSLQYLSCLPITTLKIDRQFVTALGRPNTNSIYRWILGLAAELNLRVVTEGVETQQQYDHVMGEGAQFIQGYHIARPLPVSECMENILKGEALKRQRSA